LRNLFGPRILLALGFGVLIAAATAALAAANTVPASKGGDGSGAITGYTISNIDYTLNTSDPRDVDLVTFTTDLAPPAGATVKIKLVAAGSTWYSCTMSGSPAVNASCNTTAPSAQAMSANELRIVIAQ
jgi:hypothetical protein